MVGEFRGDAIRQSKMYVQVHERKALGEPYVSPYLHQYG